MNVLVDVLLSLLAAATVPLPSAPLRDACEATFRAFADCLTATGMSDLLRVVTQAPDQATGACRAGVG